MNLAEAKTAAWKATLATFDDDYPNADFRGINVTLDYPVRAEDYPGIWIDFTPSDQFEVAQIGDPQSYEVVHDVIHSYTTWRFKGLFEFTVVALGALEHARLFDELAKVMAFGRENPKTSTFRSMIESNAYVAMNIDFDQIGVGGFTQVQGTPWGSDQVIWEGTLSMEVVGEFNSDGTTGELVPLSKVVIYAIPLGDPDPPDGWGS